MVMLYYNEKNHELDDKAILGALKQSVADYENGAIIDVRDSLLAIVDAIEAFEEDFNGGN